MRTNFWAFLIAQVGSLHRGVPVTVVRPMRATIGTFHPGMRYLLDMGPAESTTENGEAGVPYRLDWTAPATVTQVIQRRANAQ